MPRGVVVDLHLAPPGEGIELELAVGLLDHFQLEAPAALEALAPRDPAVEVGQGQVERRHLADGAAGVGVGLPEALRRILNGQILIGRPQVAHIGQSEFGRERLAIVEGLAEQHPGVQEQHRDMRIDLGGHVQQHRRFRPKGGHQGHAVAQKAERCLQDRLRAGVAQAGVQRRRQSASV